MQGKCYGFEGREEIIDKPPDQNPQHAWFLNVLKVLR